MPRRVLRTKEELEGILAQGNLALAETYDSEKSYPKNAWVLTRCQKCGVVAHYRLQYVMDKAGSPEPVCRACFWTVWALRNRAPWIESVCHDRKSAEAYANKYDFDLVDLILPAADHDAVLLVKCQVCGRQSVLCEKDIHFGCSCQTHPNTASFYAPPVTRDVVIPKETHKRVGMRTMNADEARVTPVSEVPELLEAWNDERDPAKTMVWPTGWRGMRPGDGQYRFKCESGHHPYAFPYTYLKYGCPFCRGNATKGTGFFLADISPELAAEWLQERNGKWTPENIRQDSRRLVWWRCLSCGYEWQATPRSRSKRDGQLCPHCGKVQGSIAWVYPRIASEWDESNGLSSWRVRPHASLPFVPLWDCPKVPQHKYRATVPSRVAGAECPECVDIGKSRVEMRYFEAARKTFGGARSGVRYAEPAFSHEWSVDISVCRQGRTVAIEYDGAYWHGSKEEVDTRKSLELVSAGFIVIRLREDGLDSLPIDSKCYSEVFVSPTEKDVAGVMRQVLDTTDAILGAI